MRIWVWSAKHSWRVASSRPESIPSSLLWMAEDSSSAGESGYQMENALGDTLETERRGCGIAKEDFSLAKNFALPGEGRKLQIGANAGNAFNRHTWWFLNGAVGTPG